MYGATSYDFVHFRHKGYLYENATMVHSFKASKGEQMIVHVTCFDWHPGSPDKTSATAAKLKVYGVSGWRQLERTRNDWPSHRRVLSTAPSTYGWHLSLRILRPGWHRSDMRRAPLHSLLHIPNQIRGAVTGGEAAFWWHPGSQCAQ